MGKVEFSKEVTKSNVDTKDEKLVRKKLYTEISIHWNNKWYDIRTKIRRVHPIRNYDVSPILQSSNDDANMWSHHKPSNI